MDVASTNGAFYLQVLSTTMSFGKHQNCMYKILVLDKALKLYKKMPLKDLRLSCKCTVIGGDGIEFEDLQV